MLKFYINYEECKSAIVNINNPFSFSFILTMRNVNIIGFALTSFL